MNDEFTPTSFPTESTMGNGVMPQSPEPVLEAVGVRCLRADTAEDAAEAIQAGLMMSFHGGEAVAVLIGQKLIGAKAFSAPAAQDATGVQS